MNTNPTPSPDTPSQAALAAATPRTDELYAKIWLPTTEEESDEALAKMRDFARTLERELTQLAETNAKALADERELLEIARSSIELLRGQVANYSKLAQSQAREKALASHLQNAVDHIRFLGASCRGFVAAEDSADILFECERALASHHAVSASP